jgi:hypothetical protein
MPGGPRRSRGALRQPGVLLPRAARQEIGTYDFAVRRALLTLIGLYLLIAVCTWTAEALGLGEKVPRIRCACDDSCWCKRPGLALFRWVTPARWHHIGHTPDEKRGLALQSDS